MVDAKGRPERQEEERETKEKEESGVKRERHKLDSNNGTVPHALNEPAGCRW